MNFCTNKVVLKELLAENSACCPVCPYKSEETGQVEDKRKSGRPKNLPLSSADEQ